jgi:hypothetical protein
MEEQPKRYPALYVIFALLSAIRRGVRRQDIWREFRRQKIALRPRLVFWIALCRTAGLIEERSSQLYVTRRARSWLKDSSDQQTFALLTAWQDTPRNTEARQFRRKLIWKLKFDLPLTRKDETGINGLEALGFYEAGKLTRWGCFFIKGEGELGTPAPRVPCQIQDGQFVGSLPSQADLFWELENYLRPARPGRYPLTLRALRFLQGDPHDLVALLERGLHGPLPDGIKARLFDQPSLRVIEGVVLEFSHAGDLRELRRQPGMRRRFEYVLSPRHVFVSGKDSRILTGLLRRRGVHLALHEDLAERSVKRTHFPQKPVLQPAGKQVPKLEILETYLRWQQALDVLYRAPGYPAEKRRITPLLIEQRGEQTYITAYCQTRRGQRTFRLDRMEIPGAY